ncbi:MAB_1171c family putative transporter [Streptomyces sp. NPDC006367]|uniref:MAB_1171c family putative transporter n=1 Tax=unclassified Streptomyces TaxID=2593676 RepID=UPI0033AC2D8B
MSVLAYAIAGVMTGVAVWRLPAVIYGDAHRRSLWACYAGFAAALWLKSPSVKMWLNNSPIIDLSILAKHYVSIMAILAICAFVVTNYGTVGHGEVPRHVAVSRWVTRVGIQTAAGALVLMTVLFFAAVQREQPSVDFMVDHRGQWGASAYMTVFYVYLGAASAICGYQWASAYRRSDTRLLRAGLLLMSIAMGIGVTYVICRVSFIWSAFVIDYSNDVATDFAHTTDLMQTILFFLFAIGASVPTTNTAASRWTARRALYRLYPLWRDLMTAFPDRTFSPPASRWREVTRLSTPGDVRLDRWVADIGDAVEALRHYAPPMLLPVAEQVAAESEDPQSTTEALWIKASLQASAADERRSQASAGLPSKPFTDTDAEASWLLRVQDAYSAISVEQAQVLLDAAKELTPA